MSSSSTASPAPSPAPLSTCSSPRSPAKLRPHLPHLHLGNHQFAEGGNPVQLVRSVALRRCGSGSSRWIRLKCGCCATDDRGNEYTGKADSGCSTGGHQGHLSKRLCVTARNLKPISGNSDGSRGFVEPEEAQLSQIPAFPSSSQPDSRTTNPGRTVMFITTVFSGEIDFADTKVRGLIHLRSTACVICEG